MKKKVLSIILALTLTISLFACGGGNKAESVEENIEWECENCGKTNKGKFCADCGHPVPEWTCEECGATNIGKFCTECGAMNKTIVGNDLIIASAVDAFTNYDVVGALTLLDTAENLTDAQQNLVDALRAEIEEACYKGTHFIKFEYMENLTVNGSKLIGSFEKGGYSYKCNSYGKKTSGEKLTYYSYSMSGEYSSSQVQKAKSPSGDYLKYLRDYYQYDVIAFKNERPDLWNAWAFHRGKLEFPQSMCIDDLGNMLVWLSDCETRFGVDWELDLSIRLAD